MSTTKSTAKDIFCLDCQIYFPTHIKLHKHIPNCIGLDPNKSKSTIILNGEEKLTSYIEDISVTHSVTLKKKTISAHGILFFCNFKCSLKGYICPFTIILKVYDTAGRNKYYVQSIILNHSHTINMNNLRLLDREFIQLKAMLLMGMDKKDILKEVNENFVSPKARYIGPEYINNIAFKLITRNISNNESEVFLSKYNNLINNNNLIQHYLKVPGVDLEQSDYPAEDLICCFSFKSQIDFIAANEITYLLADTTYSTNKQGYLLTTFFSLGPDERNIPIFFIISSSEASNILIFCLQNFYKNVEKFARINIIIVMSYMAKISIRLVSRFFQENTVTCGVRIIFIKHLKQI